MPKMLEVEDRPLGRKEVAAALGVKPGTVKQWQRRGVIPEPDLVVSGLPAWWESNIVTWAKRREAKRAKVE